jgi:hypothetical protein
LLLSPSESLIVIVSIELKLVYDLIHYWWATVFKADAISDCAAWGLGVKYSTKVF